MKQISQEQRAILRSPLPDEAITQNPAKPFLSAIKPIYIVERLNDVFGVGSWSTKVELLSMKDDGTTLVKTCLDIPEYNIHIEQFGGHQDKDIGDSAKGSATDALTKCASYLEIGIDVFRGKQTHNNSQSNPANQPIQQKPSSNNNTNNGMFNNNTNNNNTTERIDFADIDKCTTVEELNSWYNSVQGSIKTDKQREWIVGRCKKHKAKLLKQQQPIIVNNPELEYK